MSAKWTEQQMQAIQCRGGDILVSAAAGSGKTAVLTQRVLSLITDREHPVDITNLLIVTFSNAAAAEMRTRIAAKLYERLAEEPDNAQLRRQSLLVGSAPISTIHSFCFRVIRENFQALELPGDLRLGDEQEMKLLRHNVAASLLEEEYASGDPVFLRLVELLSGSRSDSNVEKNLLTLYDFIRNHAFYRQWVEMQLLNGDKADFDKSVWAEILKAYALDALDYCQRCLMEAIMPLEGLPECDPALQTLRIDLDMVSRIYDSVKNDGWDTSFARVTAASFERFPTIRDPRVREIKDRALARRKEVKDIISELKTKVFLMNSEGFLRDERELQPLIHRFFALALKFDENFSREKLLRGKLDFSDLEHDTLALLEKDGCRTPLAQSLGGQYAEILMDEYQDTNELQERIFSALAGKETPRFMVGDVKQSIYRFREACPDIFLRKKELFTPCDGRHFPAKIFLSANFRTRREITGFVNTVFSGLMSVDAGEMEYTPEEALDSRLDYDYSVSRPVTALALDVPKDWSREQTVAAEARRVAAEIKRMIAAGFPVEENGVKRLAQPRDFCILLRTAKKWADFYLDALREAGLSAGIEKKEGFLGTREITALLSYLKILRNPMLDLELAGVLTSPMYGCTGDDIAEARLINRRENLYLTIQSEKCAGNPRLADFLRHYSALRRAMQSEPCSHLIRDILEMTDFVEKCEVLPQGKQRVANIRLLLQYAADYEKDSRELEFTDYLSRLAENGFDLPSASVSGDNAVSIMTVHHSKGLEFPVVFLADLGGEFNREEQREDICLHKDLGFACKLRDNNAMRQHKTLPFAAMQLENRRAETAELMRVLYVALTRPREKLYLVASDKHLEDKLRPLGTGARGKMLPWQARSASSFLDWLGPWIGDPLAENLEVCRETLLEGENQKVPDAALPAPELMGEERALLQKLKQNLLYRYPYQVETEIPRRVSVSELAERDVRGEYRFRRRPKCLAAESLTAAERGTAAHKVMQFADYKALASNPEAEMQRLVEEGYLYREEGEQLDPEMILRLIRSPLGQRLIHADRVMLEVRFLQEFTPEELAAVDPLLKIAGKTLIMGAIDCIIVEKGEATVIDYKTDRIKDPEQLRARYCAQVRLYRAIAQRQLELPVKQLLLYSFELGMEIPIE